MPIYEYACNDCGHELEALQRISDDPLIDCPSCGEPALKKRISAAAFRLGGSGWYETDFKSGNKRNLKESKSEPAAKVSDSCGSGACPACQ
jgi:putative FmdB family regulatory protein